MKIPLIVVALLVPLSGPALAHRLDEYLQAAIVSIGPARVEVEMRLVPGVAVADKVISAIDADRDGKFSKQEQRLYALRVMRDLTLTNDGHALAPELEQFSFPSAAEMKAGLGEIRFTISAGLPAETGRRTLRIENRHQPGMSVYLMNCLVPADPAIRLLAQHRNSNQSDYQVEYGSDNGPTFVPWRQRINSDLSSFAGTPEMFRLGMRHIAEGTDHLLFLLALLLPAPLIGCGSLWTGVRGVRDSLVRILRIVTAFTVGHSITLALGALGIASLPSRAVEVAIAASILVSAAHALRPLFPGREPLIAAGFGLVHGLAFAATLQNLGAGIWQRLASILGFNLGIEAMQLIVVGLVLPSLMLLSRTPTYRWFRIVGGLLAGFAALEWIVERVFGLNSSLDGLSSAITAHGVFLAALLLIASATVWMLQYALPSTGIGWRTQKSGSLQ